MIYIFLTKLSLKYIFVTFTPSLLFSEVIGKLVAKIFDVLMIKFSWKTYFDYISFCVQSMWKLKIQGYTKDIEWAIATPTLSIGNIADNF